MPHNAILRSLAAADPKTYAELSKQLEAVPLERGAVLSPSRQPATLAAFVEVGVIAMVASTRSGHSVQVALVGKDGVAGVADVLGTEPLPYRTVVQVPGLAFRVRRDHLRTHMLSCDTLHDLLMGYSQRLLHQIAQSAVCNRFHSAAQRLARWLLLTADRTGTLRLELTHDFVAQMVGAPRSAVSEAAAHLRSQGIIDYRRGVLTIRHVKRLRAASCECYVPLLLKGEEALPAARQS